MERPWLVIIANLLSIDIEELTLASIPPETNLSENDGSVAPRFLTRPVEAE